MQRITLTSRPKQVTLVIVLLSKDEMSMSIVSVRVFLLFSIICRHSMTWIFCKADNHGKLSAHVELFDDVC